MTDATKSYVVDSLFHFHSPSFAIRFVYLAPKSVTFYERSFVLPHCASAATQFGQVPLFFLLFFALFFCLLLTPLRQVVAFVILCF